MGNKTAAGTLAIWMVRKEFPMPDAKHTAKDSATKDTTSKPAVKPGTKVENMPPEGPHARPDLTDHDKTPGTGSLPDSDTKGVDIGPG
jgi:hypothetical protein